MKTFYLAILILFVLLRQPSHAQNSRNIIISEVYYSSSGNDWVEIKCISSGSDGIDISSFYATMYYGTNERLSADQITLYSFDKPDTPYDDRFAVIYLTSSKPDETDFTGDANKNGILEIHCNNYSSSLWNSEAVIALDTNDDPNDGMIDFLFYSNQDSSINSNVEDYVTSAVATSEWKISGNNIQLSSVKINDSQNNISIIRNSYSDTNSSNDFKISAQLTPGKENIFKNPSRIDKKLFNIPLKKNIFSAKQNQIFLNINTNTSVIIEGRLFTSDGFMISKSEKYSLPISGNYNIELKLKKHTVPGLYVALLEANSEFKVQKEKFVLVIAE